ncbi:MAG: hypothetical protein PHO30_04935 [Candidatus Omnitrophica bacterium]|nr:hypothetical protein [Candidatus Omnitrophota bacterium]
MTATEHAAVSSFVELNPEAPTTAEMITTSSAPSASGEKGFGTLVIFSMVIRGAANKLAVKTVIVAQKKKIVKKTVKGNFTIALSF